jgi:hypothetical protein
MRWAGHLQLHLQLILNPGPMTWEAFKFDIITLYCKSFYTCDEYFIIVIHKMATMRHKIVPLYNISWYIVTGLTQYVSDCFLCYTYLLASFIYSFTIEDWLYLCTWICGGYNKWMNEWMKVLFLMTYSLVFDILTFIFIYYVKKIRLWLKKEQLIWIVCSYLLHSNDYRLLVKVPKWWLSISTYHHWRCSSVSHHGVQCIRRTEFIPSSLNLLISSSTLLQLCLWKWRVSSWSKHNIGINIIVIGTLSLVTNEGLLVVWHSDLKDW